MWSSWLPDLPSMLTLSDMYSVGFSFMCVKQLLDCACSEPVWCFSSQWSSSCFCAMQHTLPFCIAHSLPVCVFLPLLYFFTLSVSLAVSYSVSLSGSLSLSLSPTFALALSTSSPSRCFFPLPHCCHLWFAAARYSTVPSAWENQENLRWWGRREEAEAEREGEEWRLDEVRGKQGRLVAHTQQQIGTARQTECRHFWLLPL